MGAKTDQTMGRMKQAVGAVTGDEETKRRRGAPRGQGQAQEQARLSPRQGERALEDLKHRVDEN